MIPPTMPLHTLDLDPLQLEYPSGQLRLAVNARAEFKVPLDVASPGVDWAAALASGILWVGHARACRIDIQISLDDRPLNSERRAQILWPLGSRVLGTGVGAIFI